MAKLIPTLSSCTQRMTPGERRFAQRLEEKLEDEVLVWYDVPVGPRRQQPDFVILHPERGLFILEVKDWRLETIQQVSPTRVTLLTENRQKQKVVQNPLEQARDYALAIKDLLESDPDLVEQRGPYQGKLIKPYAYGVVFANITRKQFEAEPALRQVFTPNLVFCWDEFYESVSALDFQQHLWQMLPYQFGDRLTAAQIDRIRWHLYPDIRITASPPASSAANPAKSNLAKSNPAKPGSKSNLAKSNAAKSNAAKTITSKPSIPIQQSIQPALLPAIAIEQSLVQSGTPRREIVSPPMPDLMRIMDIQQEQLARSLGDGHRVIHGVAGSGKTMILLHRCLYLIQQAPVQQVNIQPATVQSINTEQTNTEQFNAQPINKPILVLCFNVTLASKLDQMVKMYVRENFNLSGKAHEMIIVQNFHRWCNSLLETHQIPPLRGDQADDHDALVQRVILAVESGRIPTGQYHAILIDEGHDFKPNWLKLVAEMVDSETRSLLLLYDDAQSIYKKPQRRGFTFKSVGIQAQGRTSILRLNYRNTAEILSFAYGFAQDFLPPTKPNQDDEPMVVQPETAGRHGLQPELVIFPSFRDEVEYLASRIQQFHQQGIAWNEMAILYRERWMGKKIWQRFQRFGLPLDWVNQDKDSRRYKPMDSSVKLLTLHSSKGLEFPVVLIAGLGYLPDSHHSLAEEARLLYVGMTRAMDRLVLTGDRPSPFVQQLQTILKSG